MSLLLANWFQLILVSKAECWILTHTIPSYHHVVESRVIHQISVICQPLRLLEPGFLWNWLTDWWNQRSFALEFLNFQHVLIKLDLWECKDEGKAADSHMHRVACLVARSTPAGPGFTWTTLLLQPVPHRKRWCGPVVSVLHIGGEPLQAKSLPQSQPSTVRRWHNQVHGWYHRHHVLEGLSLKHVKHPSSLHVSCPK